MTAEDHREAFRQGWNAAVEGAIKACRADMLVEHERQYSLGVQDCKRAIEAMLERPGEYEAKNPLGGPANLFWAIAERIEVGEDYHAVLRDMGIQHVERPAQDLKP